MNKPSELTACVQCATEGGRELVRRIDVAGSFPCALAKREATCSVHLIELLPAVVCEKGIWGICLPAVPTQKRQR